MREEIVNYANKSNSTGYFYGVGVAMALQSVFISMSYFMHNSFFITRFISTIFLVMAPFYIAFSIRAKKDLQEEINEM